jgi:hypothetical protein
MTCKAARMACLRSPPYTLFPRDLFSESLCKKIRRLQNVPE